MIIIMIKMKKKMRNEKQKIFNFAHWSYELTENNFFLSACIKMSYYWFNRKEILQKAKERYSKEIAAEYYLQNKEAIKRNVKRAL